MAYNFYIKCNEEFHKQFTEYLLNWDLSNQKCIPPLNTKFDYNLRELRGLKNTIKHDTNVRLISEKRGINFIEFYRNYRKVKYVECKKKHMIKLLEQKILFQDKLIKFYIKYSTDYIPNKKKLYNNWNIIKLKIVKKKNC